jgi:hypothetical protein
MGGRGRHRTKYPPPPLIWVILILIRNLYAIAHSIRAYAHPRSVFFFGNLLADRRHAFNAFASLSSIAVNSRIREPDAGIRCVRLDSVAIAASLIPGSL